MYEIYTEKKRVKIKYFMFKEEFQNIFGRHFYWC